MTLDLALGRESHIVVVKATEQEKREGKLASEFVGLVHRRKCTETECEWGCPIRNKRLELEYGVTYSERCSPSYCDMLCPLMRVRTGG
jgi:hypothetical protein